MPGRGRGRGIGQPAIPIDRPGSQGIRQVGARFPRIQGPGGRAVGVGQERREPDLRVGVPEKRIILDRPDRPVVPGMGRHGVAANRGGAMIEEVGEGLATGLGFFDRIESVQGPDGVDRRRIQADLIDGPIPQERLEWFDDILLPPLDQQALGVQSPCCCS